MKVLSFFLILCLMASCATNKIDLQEDAEGSRAAILKFVPIGTSISQGKEIMEQNKFKCEYMLNTSFGDYQNIDFVFCDYRESRGIMMAQRWQVALVYKDTSITEVLVSTGLIGP